MLILDYIPQSRHTFIYGLFMKTQSKRGFQKWLANALGITEPLLSMLINERRGISVDIANRLVKILPDTTISFWLNMPMLNLEVCLWELCKDQYIKSLSKTSKGKERKK